MPQNIPPTTKLINLAAATYDLIKFEFKKNRFAFLIPGLFFIIVLTYLMLTGVKPISPNSSVTWLILGATVVLAMVYGLQCFSSEADKHTLDFILTRPLSPYLLLMVKYFLSLVILLGWLGLFSQIFKIDLSLLSLPKEIRGEWLLLLLLLIHGTSCLSGLLAKGLERIAMVILMISFAAGASYFIWSQVLELTKANFYWLDVPPALLNFIKQILPLYLALISLAIPLTAVVWWLRRRCQPWRFKPLQWLSGTWLLTGLLLLLAQQLLAPPLWPDQRALYGEWHHQGGLVLAGAQDRLVSSKSLLAKKVPCYLSLAAFGNKPHYKHLGLSIRNPHFSPNGRQLLFSENGRLKLLDIRTKRLTDLAPAALAAWSEDSRQIIYAQTVGAEGLSQLYRLDLSTRQRYQLSSTRYNLADLAWNSGRDQLYLISYYNKLSCLNLRTKKLQAIPFPKTEQPEINFAFLPPTVVLLPQQNLLLLGQAFQERIRIFRVDLKTNQLQLSETLDDFRIKQLPLLIKSDGTALIWSRIDGTFVYQTTYYQLQLEHASHDHRGHHHF